MRLIMIAASPPMLQSVRLWRSLKPRQVHPASDTHQISQESSYPPWFSQRLCLDDGHCSEAYLFLIFIFSKMTPVVLNGKILHKRNSDFQAEKRWQPCNSRRYYRWERERRERQRVKLGKKYYENKHFTILLLWRRTWISIPQMCDRLKADNKIPTGRITGK